MPDFYANGGWRVGKRAEVYVGGRWRTLTRGEAYINGAWRQIFSFAPPFTVSVSPSAVSGARSTYLPSYGVVTSNTTTATPSGGTAPFSYQWTMTSGIATPTKPTLASTAFTAGLAADSSDTSTAIVTVTDSLGVTATASVSVNLTNFSTA